MAAWVAVVTYLVLPQVTSRLQPWLVRTRRS